MKTFKIRKSEYNNMEALLKRVGATNDEMTKAYPHLVYANEKDLKKMNKAVVAEFKKQSPHYTKKHIAFAAGMYMLNLSPSTLKGNPLKDGYLLVDNLGIKEEQNGEQIK